MKAQRIAAVFAALLCCTTLSSCLFSQMAQKFQRDTYPGERPPHVILDNNGKPASNNWLQVDPYTLPASGALIEHSKTADDGIPYGLPSEFSDIIVSPYAPYYQLDYSGCSVGEKVWDPYTRKPFYIRRHYTFN